MDSPIPTLNCTQCGGELHPDEGQIFLTCPSCGSTVYLDAARVVFHWYIAPTLDENQAGAALRRWMSGAQTVKDLDEKARITGGRFAFFPLWYIKEKTQGGESERIQPAAATSVTELAGLRLPAGDFKRYDAGLDPQAVQPSVPLETALAWLEQGRPAQPQPQRRETALVHVPLYTFTYEYNHQSYTAVVDAASGTVLANLFPAKAEAPYLVVGLVAAFVYLCLAVIPLALSGGGLAETRLPLGLLVCAGGGIVAAPLLFFWAFWVASKV